MFTVYSLKLKTYPFKRAYFPYNEDGKKQAANFRKIYTEFKGVHLQKATLNHNYFVGKNHMHWGMVYTNVETVQGHNKWKTANLETESQTVQPVVEQDNADWAERKYPKNGDYVQLLRNGVPCEDFTFVKDLIRKTETPDTFIIHDMYDNPYEVVAVPERDHMPHKAFRVVNELQLVDTISG